ncbi:MAG: riboflavin synthase, partial [Candidatus Peregrinibacteria bacterium]
MFTGIIETTGKILKRTTDRIVIETPIASELKTGSSIAVDGICLTVTEAKNGRFTANVMPETIKKTTLADNTGSVVNLERAMPANGRWEGHLVTGHVEGVGKITQIKDDGNAKL